MSSEGYIKANGVRLYYTAEGCGGLILFLHGFPEFWYAWKNQLAEFGKDHRAVAIDMRGFNLSEKPSTLSDYTLSKLVEDVRESSLHFSRGERFVLVGHDWGGYVAWMFASAYPEALHKLVIINAPHPTIFAQLLNSNPAQRKASEYMQMFRSDRAEETLSADQFEFLAKIMAFGKTNGVLQEEKLEYIKAWSQPSAITGGLNYYRANNLAGNMLQRRPVIINVPTLVIWGGDDPAMVAENLDGLDEYVPTLTVKRIPDASHWLVHTHFAEVNRLIRDFLD